MGFPAASLRAPPFNAFAECEVVFSLMPAAHRRLEGGSPR